MQFVRDEIDDGKRDDALVREAVVSYDEKQGIKACTSIAPELPPPSKHGALVSDDE